MNKLKLRFVTNLFWTYSLNDSDLQYLDLSRVWSWIKVTQNLPIGPWIMSNHCIKIHKVLMSCFWTILLTYTPNRPTTTSSADITSVWTIECKQTNAIHEVSVGDGESVDFQWFDAVISRGATLPLMLMSTSISCWYWHLWVQSYTRCQTRLRTWASPQPTYTSIVLGRYTMCDTHYLH